jgi:hypothetical protein
MFDDIDKLFSPETRLGVIISIHTNAEPGFTQVKNNIETLKQKIQDHYEKLAPWNYERYPGYHLKWKIWMDEGYKQWWALREYREEYENDARSSQLVKITVCDQYQLPWTTHYQGLATEMRPTYDYNDVNHTENHHWCQARDFVTLYKGTMYKCPPVGVLEHTLTTFGITDHPDWAPYLENYKSVNTNSADEDIQTWFANQSGPESVCNMCGFSGPNARSIQAGERARAHEFKEHWNYTL